MPNTPSQETQTYEQLSDNHDAALNGIIDDVYAEELAEQQAQASKNSKTNLEEDDSEDSSDSNNSNSGTSNYSDGVLIINNYE